MCTRECAEVTHLGQLSRQPGIAKLARALAATHDIQHPIAILSPDQQPMVLNEAPHWKGPGVVGCEKLHVQPFNPTRLGDELSARSIGTDINVHEVAHDTVQP